MSAFEEIDLFGVIKEWGYEMCVIDQETLRKMPPAERRDLIDQVRKIDPEAAEELVKCLP